MWWRAKQENQRHLQLLLNLKPFNSCHLYHCFVVIVKAVAGLCKPSGKRRVHGKCYLSSVPPVSFDVPLCCQSPWAKRTWITWVPRRESGRPSFVLFPLFWTNVSLIFWPGNPDCACLTNRIFLMSQKIVRNSGEGQSRLKASSVFKSISSGTLTLKSGSKLSSVVYEK